MSISVFKCKFSNLNSISATISGFCSWDSWAFGLLIPTGARPFGRSDPKNPLWNLDMESSVGAHGFRVARNCPGDGNPLSLGSLVPLPNFAPFGRPS